MLRMSTHIMVCVCHLKTKYPFEVTYPSVGCLPGLSVWSLHVLPVCVCVCVCAVCCPGSSDGARMQIPPQPTPPPNGTCRLHATTLAAHVYYQSSESS